MSRPAIAAQLGLPEKHTLDYIQALVLTIAVVGASVYLVARAARDPKAIKRAARKATGA